MKSVERGPDDRSDNGPDLVGLYLEEIGLHPLLTAEDEYKLWFDMELGRDAAAKLEAAEGDGARLPRRQRKGYEEAISTGAEARDTMINSNLRLVVSIAKRYQNSGMPLMDLIQEGNVGLHRAVDKFDGAKGFKFSTYATWWVKQAISRGIPNDVRTIRLPSGVDEDLRAVERGRKELEKRGISEPGTQELSEVTGKPPEEIERLSQVSILASTVSLDQPVGEDESGGSSLGDVIADRTTSSPDEHMEQLSDAVELVEIMRGAIEKGAITGKGARILALRYGLDGNGKQTWRKIGEEYGVTHEAVRRLGKQTEERLRQYVDFYGLSREQVA